MPCISVPTALLIGGAASIGGAALSANAAQSAAKTQASAANNATQATLNMYNATANRLAPWVTAGQGAQEQLNYLTGVSQTAPAGGSATGGGAGSLVAPFQPTMEQLAATPGYQFTLQQGLQGVQNSYAAQGLGSSGAALKGAANYAEGLAGTTYQQQFGNYLAQNQQIYNMLGGLSSTGENAAAQTGSLGLQAQSQANALQVGAANAAAAGQVGAANAWTSGLGSIGNTAMLAALQSQGMFGGNALGGGSSGWLTGQLY